MNWVDVEKELPPYDKDVILYSPQTPNYCRIGRRDYTNKYGEHYSSIDEITWAITHWMPLPADPPNREKLLDRIMRKKNK